MYHIKLYVRLEKRNPTAAQLKIIMFNVAFVAYMLQTVDYFEHTKINKQRVY